MDQIDFADELRAATNRLWEHRKALRRVMVRIGFWPDGLVIGAHIRARNGQELQASLAPRVIPWTGVAMLRPGDLVLQVNEVCAPLYDALGVKPGEDQSAVGLLIVGGTPERVVSIAGYDVKDMGVPMVEIGGDIDYLDHLRPEKADEFADLLKAAAKRARGEV